MAGQISVIPDGLLSEFKHSFERQLRAAASALDEDFASYFDRNLREMVIAGLTAAEADEGTIWIIDAARETLLPVFNSGPHAAEFVGRFRQSLRSGMISMVVATEQPMCENDVHMNQRQDRTLDSQLGVQTCAMIAVPFYFAGELRGVLSGVQLRSPGDTLPKPHGFAWEHLLVLQRTATLLGRLIEHRLMLRILGAEWA
ncbi:GAF domain-containing protein [Verrucomicrobiota bacterium sgz303538]